MLLFVEGFVRLPGLSELTTPLGVKVQQPLGVHAHSGVVVFEKTIELPPLFPPYRSVPAKQPLEIAPLRSVIELFFAELPTLLAEMPRVPASRKPLIGEDALTAPAEVGRGACVAYSSSP